MIHEGRGPGGRGGGPVSHALATVPPVLFRRLLDTFSRFAFPLALLLRGCLLLYAEWQDANFAVKYTDVDYAVFCDAAAALAQGDSPFRRATYRYTPLLAYAMMPSVRATKLIPSGVLSIPNSISNMLPWFGEGGELVIPALPWFGKLLFVGADIAVGVLIQHVLTARGMRTQVARTWAALYLFHPFSWTVSTRGNADGIVGALVLFSMVLIMQHRVVASAVVYGLAVHFKIYPIIYAPAFLVLLEERDYRGCGEAGSGNCINSIRNINHSSNKSSINRTSSSSSKGGYCDCRVVFFLRDLFNRDRVVFALVSGTTFFCLGALFYLLFGYEFLYETYLYHLIRKDNRHNFSVYFYDLYLGFSGSVGPDSAASPRIFGSHTLAFLPQFGVALALALRFGKDLPFALAAQTMAFVTFNKVRQKGRRFQFKIAGWRGKLSTIVPSPFVIFVINICLFYLSLLSCILHASAGLYGAVLFVVLLPATSGIAADSDPWAVAGNLSMRTLVCQRVTLALLGISSRVCWRQRFSTTLGCIHAVLWRQCPNPLASCAEPQFCTINHKWEGQSDF